MNTLAPIEPNQRSEILDIFRGFPLLGIIFNDTGVFTHTLRCECVLQE